MKNNSEELIFTQNGVFMIGISPVELNGMVSRTQDFSAIKQNDDVKPQIDQGNFQAQTDQKVDQGSTTVVSGQKTETDSQGAGSGGYGGDGGKNRKKKDDVPKEGRVIRKKNGGFEAYI